LVEGDSAEVDYGPIYKFLGLNVPRSNQDRPTAAIGYTEAKNRDAVMALLTGPEAKRILPKAARFVWDAKPFPGQNGEKFHTLYALNTKGRKESKLSGESVISSFATPNSSGRGFAVSLSMDSEGARVWKKMTTDNVGRQVAVVLDNQVYSAPNVEGPIPNGNTSISGGFDEVTEARDLANILSVGKLPCRPEIIEEAVVGASLGEATVSAGLWSLAIGFLFVLLFMIGYYGGAGIIAVICLFLNIIFIIGSLASFGTVLTLPGIAGIVLTIGMAVDAGVIIFERIREELRASSHWKDAILNGFKYSYSAIIDANLTTLVVAFI
jgi:SecD/SecF fusion protein